MLNFGVLDLHGSNGNFVSELLPSLTLPIIIFPSRLKVQQLTGIFLFFVVFILIIFFCAISLSIPNCFP